MKTPKTNLTADQERANNAFLDFLVNDENFLVIQGAAGTGKSFLIRYLLETFYSRYKSYCLLLSKEAKTFDIKITATTNKAVSVVSEFLNDLLDQRNDLSVSTIFSLLGLKVVNDHSSGKTTLEFTNNKYTPAGVVMNKNVTPLVFIDEASFIGEDLHSVIEKVLKEEANAKIIYIGDQYQLAPVGQSFSAMEHVQCTKISLNEILRNSGEILKTGTQFRNTVETGIFKPINYNDNDIIHVTGPEFQRLVEDSFNDPNWNPSISKVLAWKNVTVQDYNQHIRQSMNLPKLFKVGEVAITNEFIKGNNNFTRSVDSKVTITNINPTKENIYDVSGYIIELDGGYVGFMPENFQDAKNLLKVLAARAKADKRIWKKYFEVKETWLDLRAIYASSIHKSQGSTYDTVFLNLADIGRNWNSIDVARLMYVGITRAAKQVVCYGYLPDRYCN